MNFIIYLHIFKYIYITQDENIVMIPILERLCAYPSVKFGTQECILTVHSLSTRSYE